MGHLQHEAHQGYWTPKELILDTESLSAPQNESSTSKKKWKSVIYPEIIR